MTNIDNCNNCSFKIIPFQIFILILSLHVEVVGANDLKECEKSGRCSVEGITPTRIEYPTNQPPLIGQGWTTPAGTKSDAICIQFEQKEQNYQDVAIDLSFVQDNNHFLSKSDASLNAKVNGLFGGFEASATIRIAKETGFTANSTRISARATVDQGPIFVAPPETNLLEVNKDLEDFYKNTWQWQDSRNIKDLIVDSTTSRIQLKDEYVEMAKNDMNKFLHECGDSFVDVIHRGGILVGSLNFTDTTSSEKEELLHEVGGGGGGATFSASIKRQIDKFNENKRLTMKFEATGGSDVTLPTDADSLYRSVQEFPGKVANAPKPIWMTVRRYDSLINWPPVGPINIAEPSGGEELVRSYMQLLYIEGVLNEIITHSAGWLFAWDMSLDELKTMRHEVRVMENEVESKGKECAINKNCAPGNWAKWRDFDLLVRLPIRGNFEADINNYCPTPPIPPLDDLPSYYIFRLVKEQRIRFWVNDIDNMRCAQLKECLEPQVLNSLYWGLNTKMLENIKYEGSLRPKQCPY